MKKRKSILAKLLCAVLAISLTAGAVSSVELKEVKAHDIPAYQQKDVFATETVKIQGITVEKVVNDTVSPVITSTIQEPVKFVIYNSTKQTVEQRVESENGMLPELNLVKNHNYIIFAEDSKYRMPNVYIWVNGNRIVDIKKNVDPDTNTYDYPEVKSLLLYERDSEEPNPEGTNRVFINLPVRYGDGPMANVRFKLVSAVETVEAVTTNSGQLRADILEDITYMVVADNDQYAVEPLALAAKDKSEYKLGRYAYNHADCNRIDTIQLVDKKDAHKNDTIATSISGKTTVTGMNFRDFLVLDKELDSSLVTGLENREYTVLDIKVINPHRWEVSKLAAGEYPVTVKIDKNRTVTNVYYLDSENQLCPLEFKQDNNGVSFTMNSMSMYPVVIESFGFMDVAREDWYYGSVNYVFCKDIMTGMDANHFGPAVELSRAQFATILYRMNGAPSMEYDADAFPDVENGQFYTKAAMWAKQTGVILGYDDGRFGPADAITREQMAVMMYRYANCLEMDTSVRGNLNDYPDSEQVSAFSKEAVEWVVGMGLIKGDGGKINSQGSAKRAECATIIMRFMEAYKM